MCQRQFLFESNLQVGTYQVFYKATSKRKAITQTRKKMVPCETCECPHIAENQSASKIMDLNGAENAFNMIEMTLKEQGRREGWPKSKAELADRIVHAIETKITPEWCHETMVSLLSRWKELINREGDLTDFYCPKYN